MVIFNNLLNGYKYKDFILAWEESDMSGAE